MRTNGPCRDQVWGTSCPSPAPLPRRRAGGDHQRRSAARSPVPARLRPGNRQRRESRPELIVQPTSSKPCLQPPGSGRLRPSVSRISQALCHDSSGARRILERSVLAVDLAATPDANRRSQRAASVKLMNGRGADPRRLRVDSLAYVGPKHSRAPARTRARKYQKSAPAARSTQCTSA
jgi:hypothetical protein